MLTILSPAKSLDMTSPVPAVEPTQPRFLAQACEIAHAAAQLPPGRLKTLMGISDKLAELNAARFAAFATPFTSDNARPAVYSFAGDVYVGFGAASAAPASIAFAQQHVRILSGLYGLLRPLDLMQAYRLEMGTRFAIGGKPDLYAYWGDHVGAALREELLAHADPTLVNLASGEYFRAVATPQLPGPVLTISFKEWRNGQLKFVSFAAKRARGAMARFICDEQIDRCAGLKDFARDGYRFEPGLSDQQNWTFVRG